MRHSHDSRTRKHFYIHTSHNYCKSRSHCVEMNLKADGTMKHIVKITRPST